jgi:hypothetical protein
MASQTVVAGLSVATAAAIGVAAWKSSLASLAMTVLVPVLVVRQTSAVAAALVSVAYYAGSAFPVATAAANFGFASPALLWAVWSILLTGVWVACWHLRARSIAFAAACTFWVTTLPPICPVGIASPLIASGVLFPGLGLAGLGLTTGLGLSLAISRFRVALVLAAISLLANATYAVSVQPDWKAIDLPAARSDFDRIEQVRSGLPTNASVAVFPEAALPNWNEATRAFFGLRQNHRIILGTTRQRDGHVENGVLIIANDRESFLSQRIPVPLAMRAFPLRLNAPGTVDVGGTRTAILICYEQLLAWPMIVASFERPQVLVGLSSHRWTANTSIPPSQALCLRSWARLFRLPLVKAVSE